MTHTSVKHKILFVSHKEKRCGVYQYGLSIANSIKKSSKYIFEYFECSNPNEFINRVHAVNPSAIIYNYYPSTLPWLNKNLISKFNAPHLGIIHEVTQGLADSLDNNFFDYHIASDPTLLLKNTILFKTGRLIPKYENTFELPKVPTIGSFGFGLHGKGFEHLIATVQQEYEQAEIRLHIPFASFGDPDGEQAKTIARHCQDLVVKPDIKLSITHAFLSQDELLNFLAQNTLNAFFYERNYGRGISSVIDFALAVQRPIAITHSTMFRHINDANPSICIEDLSLKQIAANGIEPLKYYCKEWNESNLIWDFERIIDQVLSKSLSRTSPISLKSEFKNFLKRKLGFKSIPKLNQWVRDSWDGYEVYPYFAHKKYEIPVINDVNSFNRILDNSARKQYQPLITFLFSIVPSIMAKKIPEANVQQAFIFDTVLKISSQLPSNRRVLCIGSYEDTASLALKQVGISLDEIDPIFNYSLDTFLTKPSTLKNSYDIIFSTSVIEHVENDELFITQIVDLLAPGGTAILTCDYNDYYQDGDPIPEVDFRFYTQNDFKHRFLPLLKDCFWIDEPKWDCPNPDFTYAGVYRYTFATIVFQKRK